MSPAEPNPFLVQRVAREIGDTLAELQRKVGNGAHVFIMVHVDGVTMNGGTIPPWVANVLLAAVLDDAMRRAFVNQEMRTQDGPP